MFVISCISGRGVHTSCTPSTYLILRRDNVPSLGYQKPGQPIVPKRRKPVQDDACGQAPPRRCCRPYAMVGRWLVAEAAYHATLFTCEEKQLCTHHHRTFARISLTRSKISESLTPTSTAPRIHRRCLIFSPS